MNRSNRLPVYRTVAARVLSRAEDWARQRWHWLPFSIRERLRFVIYAICGAPPLRQYAREAMNRDIAEWLAKVDTASLDAVEVGGRLREDYGWKSYTSLHYPDFDLLKSKPSGQYDVVICEQVLEHVSDPDTAVRNLRRLAREGGYVLVSTPFLIRLHGAPDDYWRFTPLGLRTLLERQGFDVEILRSWGNRSAVISNLRRWSFYRPWRPLRNNSRLPVVVWAIARAPR